MLNVSFCIIMMKRLAAMMARPAAMMKRPAAADRVADTVPDWLVEPDPTAQLYVFWSLLRSSKASITASSNLTVYKLNPVNKLQYLTRDVLAITPPDTRISTLDMAQRHVDFVSCYKVNIEIGG